MSTHPPVRPHGPLLPVVEGVHCVRGTFRMGPGVIISRTMTVLRGDDGLVIVSPVRLDEAGAAALDALGPVRHLVRLSDSHRVDEPWYVDRYQPVVWGLPGSKASADRALGPESPIAGSEVFDFPELGGWREAAWLVPHGGGTLLTVDALQNHCDHEGLSLLGRLTSVLLGYTGGVRVPPLWQRVQGVRGDAARVLGALGARSFEHLVTGHGPPVVGGAAARVRAALDAAR